MEVLGIHVQTERYSSQHKVRVYQPNRTSYLYGAVQPRQAKRIFLERVNALKRTYEYEQRIENANG